MENKNENNNDPNDTLIFDLEYNQKYIDMLGKEIEFRGEKTKVVTVDVEHYYNEDDDGEGQVGARLLTIGIKPYIFLSGKGGHVSEYGHIPVGYEEEIKLLKKKDV